jgi:hypothetical protein
MSHANAGTHVAHPLSLLIAFLAFPNWPGAAIIRLCSNIEGKGYWPMRKISGVSIRTASLNQSGQPLIIILSPPLMLEIFRSFGLLIGIKNNHYSKTALTARSLKWTLFR